MKILTAVFLSMFFINVQASAQTESVDAEAVIVDEQTASDETATNNQSVANVQGDVKGDEDASAPFSCDDPNALAIKPEACAKCENRHMKYKNSLLYETQYCVLKECPADKPLADSKGACHGCNEDFADVDRYATDCAPCANRVLEGEDIHKKCVVKVPCDDPLSFNVKKLQLPCSVCENREVIQTSKGKRCALKVCPADKPIRGGASASCYACDFLSVVTVGAPEDCAVCENRKVVEAEGKYYCALSTCPEEYPKRLENGKCAGEAEYADAMREKGIILDYGDEIAGKVGHFLLDIFEDLGINDFCRTYISPILVSILAPVGKVLGFIFGLIVVIGMAGVPLF